MTMKLAVPMSAPGGLEADVSDHFGHSDCFTLVTVEDGRVLSVETAPNAPHEQGGCLAPVNALFGLGVNALIAGGMGMRPLSGFQQKGITVYHNQGSSSAAEAVDALLAGRLPAFDRSLTCGGSGGCHGHDHGH